MITEMVVGIGNKDGKCNSPPELIELIRGRRRCLLDDLGDFQIAAPLTVDRFEHGHGTRVPDSARALPIEPIEEKDISTGHGHQLVAGSADAGAGGEGEG
nr:hypothetical protein [Cryobacterium sp. Y50]